MGPNQEHGNRSQGAGYDSRQPGRERDATFSRGASESGAPSAQRQGGRGSNSATQKRDEHGRFKPDSQGEAPGRNSESR